MPSGRDWLDLVRSTFHSVGRKDLSGLYAREWRHARARLTADHSEEIERESNRFRRTLRTANAVLFGLSKRLAPARRVLLAAVLLCLLFSMEGPAYWSSTNTRHGVVRTTEYHLYWDNGWLFLALVVLVLLLAMERPRAPAPGSPRRTSRRRSPRRFGLSAGASFPTTTSRSA